MTNAKSSSPVKHFINKLENRYIGILILILGGKAVTKPMIGEQQNKDLKYCRNIKTVLFF